MATFEIVSIFLGGGRYRFFGKESEFAQQKHFRADMHCMGERGFCFVCFAPVDRAANLRPDIN
jgi:hypothetical protein